MNRFLLLALLLIPMLAGPVRLEAETLRLPLKDFLAVDIITLQGTSDNTAEREFSIPLAARWAVRGATLRFAYSCSTALLAEASRLTVLVNDYPVAQLPLNPRVPNALAEVAIPAGRLKTGYNPLVFSVTQHVTRDECEDPSLPELWTRLDLTGADLELDLAAQPVPPMLAAIGTVLFDPRDLVNDEVQITIPEMSPAYLRRAGLAAAGAALRREYRATRFTVSNRLVPGRDHLVIGPPAFLEALGLEVSLPDAGAALAVRQLPLAPTADADAPRTDPTHGVLVITGSDDTALDRAATGFSLMSTPFPPLPAVPVIDVTEPALSPYRLRSAVLGGQAYAFSALGFESTTFSGTHPRPRGVSFRLPSDLHIEPNQPLMLSLNLAYGSGMRADSTLNIEVNDRFMAAVPLDNPAGGTYQAYQVHVLGSTLRRGRNTLRFVPVLTPPIDTKCTPIQEDNLVVTVMGDSVLSVPRFDHWIRMPDLGAFMVDGFPYSRWADLRESAICLPRGTVAEATAALNLVALTAQKIGYPPTGLVWQINAPPPDDRDLIWVGTRADLTAGPLGREAAALFPLGANSRVPEPQLRRPDGHADPLRDWHGAFKRWLGAPLPDLPSGTRYDLATEDLGRATGAGWGYLSQSRRAGTDQRTLLALTAEGEQDLIAAALRIWRPEVQANAAGGTLAIRKGAQGAEAFVLDKGDAYYLGQVGPFPVVGNLINTHPWMALGLVLALLALCSLLLFVLLRRVRRRRRTDA